MQLSLCLLQVFFKEANVKQIDVPTLTGAFGILPAHVPTLQVLRPGIVTVFNDDGSSTKYFGVFSSAVLPTFIMLTSCGFASINFLHRDFWKFQANQIWDELQYLSQS